VLVGHGLSDFLNESMMVRGDEYEMAICNQTGTLAIYNENRNLFISPMADGPIKFEGNDFDKSLNIVKKTKFGRDFSIVKVPYAFKLLYQELQALNVQMRIITEDNIDQMTSLVQSDEVNMRGNTLDINRLLQDKLAEIRKIEKESEDVFYSEENEMLGDVNSKKENYWVKPEDNVGKDSYSVFQPNTTVPKVFQPTTPDSTTPDSTTPDSDAFQQISPEATTPDSDAFQQISPEGNTPEATTPDSDAFQQISPGETPAKFKPTTPEDSPPTNQPTTPETPPPTNQPTTPDTPPPTNQPTTPDTPPPQNEKEKEKVESQQRPDTPDFSEDSEEDDY